MAELDGVLDELRQVITSMGGYAEGNMEAEPLELMRRARRAFHKLDAGLSGGRGDLPRLWRRPVPNITIGGVEYVPVPKDTFDMLGLALEKCPKCGGPPYVTKESADSTVLPRRGCAPCNIWFEPVRLR